MAKKLSDMAVTELHTYLQVLNNTYHQADGIIRFLQKNIKEDKITEERAKEFGDKLIDIALEQQEKMTEIRKELSRRVKSRLKMKHTDMDLFRINKAIQDYSSKQKEQTNEKPVAKLDKA